MKKIDFLSFVGKFFKKAISVSCVNDYHMSAVWRFYRLIVITAGNEQP